MLRFVLLDRSCRSYDPETVAVMGAAFDRVCQSVSKQMNGNDDVKKTLALIRRPGRARRRATRGDCLPRMDGHRPFGNRRPLGHNSLRALAVSTTFPVCREYTNDQVAYTFERMNRAVG
jgi:hypothetical protein